jgi:proteasome activator subunit 4
MNTFYSYRKLTASSDVFVDKINTGFLSWTGQIECYGTVQQASEISWELESQAVLDAMSQIMEKDNYFHKISLLWSQESSRSSGKVEFRWDDVAFIKTLGPYF